MSTIRVRVRWPRRVFVLVFALAGSGLVLALAVGVAMWWVRQPVPPPWVDPHPPALGWTAVVTTIAGDGGLGVVDGPAERARFDDPYGVAVAPDGTIYVSDAGDANRLRRLDASLRVSTLAGGAFEGWSDGLGTRAAFHTPSAMVVDRAGRLVVADTGNHAIRLVSPDGSVTTLTGGGDPGWVDGPRGIARFNGPIGVAVDAAGRILVADTYNDAIRVVSPDGTASTLAGGGERALVDGPTDVARFDTPAGVAVATDGVAWVADTGNHVLRRIAHDGMVTTVDAELWRPLAVVAGPDGSVYASDQRGRIVQVDGGGRVHHLAGQRPGVFDGPGVEARFSLPTGLAVDGTGAVLVADAGARLLRRVAPATGSEPRPTFDARRGRPAQLTLGLGVLPWPLAPNDTWHEVAGTVGEARGDFVDSRRRFHAGLDVFGPRGTPVVAVRNEKAVLPMPLAAIGTINESLALQVFTYVHVHVGRDPRGRATSPARTLFERDARGRLTRPRVRRGTRFAVGDVLGTTNQWAHVHLETGPRGSEIDALVLPIGGFVDTVPPTIEPGGIRLVSESGVRLGTSRDRLVEVSGRVRIEVEAYDQVDGNLPRRKLGLARLGYQVLDANGRALPRWERPRVTIDFESLPTARDAPRLAYAEGSGIAGGGQRATRFIYIVSNVVRGDIAREAFWDTSTLAPGDYVLRILAEDRHGNRAVDRHELPVVVR